MATKRHVVLVVGVLFFVFVLKPPLVYGGDRWVTPAIIGGSLLGLGIVGSSASRANTREKEITNREALQHQRDVEMARIHANTYLKSPTAGGGSWKGSVSSPWGNFGGETYTARDHHGMRSLSDPNAFPPPVPPRESPAYTPAPRAPRTEPTPPSPRPRERRRYEPPEMASASRLPDVSELNRLHSDLNKYGANRAEERALRRVAEEVANPHNAAYSRNELRTALDGRSGNLRTLLDKVLDTGARVQEVAALENAIKYLERVVYGKS